MMTSFSIWSSGGYELAEGARWAGDRLVFVDILSGRLLEAPDKPGAARVLAALDEPLGCAAPVASNADQWIVGAGTGIAFLHRGGRLEWLDRPEDRTAVPSRMNDGCCDPHGRFWAGSMAYDETPGAGSLYRTDPDGTVTRVLDGLTIVNGPAFTADGATMYVNDTAEGRMYRCRIAVESGEITEQTLFAELAAGEGYPDGLIVDDAGCVWVALWDGSAVRRYNPDGSYVDLRVPARRPTSACLTLSGWLFVTTARVGLADAGPESGALLAAAVGATAAPAAAFGAADRPAADHR